MLRWDSKKPGETDDRDLDWSLRLDTGDKITASTWVVVGSPASLTVGAHTFTDTRTKVVLSGGTDAQTYRLQNTITTLLGSSPLIEYVSIEVRDN